MKMIKKRRVEDPDKLDEFSLFIQTTKITYCKYKDSEKILGNTYGMCILQVNGYYIFTLLFLIWPSDMHIDVFIFVSGF